MVADAFRLEYDLSVADLRAYSEYAALKSARGRRALVMMRAGLFVFLLIPGVSSALSGGGFSEPGALAAYAVCVLLLAWFLPPWVQKRSAHRAVANDMATYGVAGHWSFAVDAAGIEYMAPFGSASLKWNLVAEVALTDAGVCIVSRSSRGYIVPSHAFAGIDDLRRFGEACARYAGVSLRAIKSPPVLSPRFLRTCAPRRIAPYSWDTHADRLLGYSHRTRGSGDTTASFTYDASGQRTRTVLTTPSTTTTTTYTYEGLQLFRVVSASPTQTTTLTYLYDELSAAAVAAAQVSGDPKVYFVRIVTTSRGDVTALTDGGESGVGKTLAAWAFDAYGNAMITTPIAGSARVPISVATAIVSAQPLRYAGYAYDAFSGLYYCSQRYYDPTTCQFVSADPVGADGEESAYQYCGGDPVNHTDPSGLIAIWGESAGTAYDTAIHTSRYTTSAKVRKIALARAQAERVREEALQRARDRARKKRATARGDALDAAMSSAAAGQRAFGAARSKAAAAASRCVPMESRAPAAAPGVSTDNITQGLRSPAVIGSPANDLTGRALAGWGTKDMAAARAGDTWPASSLMLTAPPAWMFIVGLSSAAVYYGGALALSGMGVVCTGLGLPVGGAAVLAGGLLLGVGSLGLYVGALCLEIQTR